MKLPLQELLIWLFIPFLNFIFWFYLSSSNVEHKSCLTSTTSQVNPPLQSVLEESQRELDSNKSPLDENRCRGKKRYDAICEAMKSNKIIDHVSVYVDKFENVDSFRAERLAPLEKNLLLKTMSTDSSLVAVREETPVSGLLTSSSDSGNVLSAKCHSIDYSLMAHSAPNCFAVVYHENRGFTYNLARVDQDIDIYGLSISVPDPSQVDEYSWRFPLNDHNKGKFWPAGFFRKVPKIRGRERTEDKLGTFLKYFDEMNEMLEKKLLKHNIKAHDDVVVMAVNEGETDLFMNFACSCRKHGISLNNVIVFSGSQEMVTVVEATGAIGLFHIGFAAVSKAASTDYLDRVFVDMMWYKAFSIYMLLRRRINILFQDVDLVWFRDPMPYFHEYLEQTKARSEQTGAFIEAFFSDDGQRSKRYTPYFANSGFYYLVATERSEYFAWSIMIAMDAIQVLGSHQNVFTTRMIEGLSITAKHAKLLSLEEFPTGIMYHHNRPYMKQLSARKVSPYNFHM